MKECQARGTLRPDHYLITTLVSTQMARAIANREGIRVEDDLLVGFKWIGQRVDDAGPHGFLFAFEESHGYLKGTHARDKDAAVAGLLFAELAATVKDRQQSVLEYLDDLFIDFGHHGDKLVTKELEGREGLARINQLMLAFRKRPPALLGGLRLTEVFDYQKHEIRTLSADSAARPLPQPSGDLLIFHTERPGTRFAVRPSGTEPKIKFYLFAATHVAGPDQLPAAKQETARRIDQLTTDLDKFVADVLNAAT
jgi:phosphoglucomutase/phosphomannomutase